MVVRVSEALAERRSVRAYLDRDVSIGLLTEIVTQASRAPSGGNVQPWHVDIVTGAKLAELKALMARRTAEDPRGEPMDYVIYPPGLTTPYEDRRKGIGEAMYGHMDIPKEDREARRAWFARNFQFFDAPAGLFFHMDRQMGPPQWADLGMLIQSVMLLAIEHGLATCPQECWAMFPKTLGVFLDLPDSHFLFCGMAIGYEDKDAAVNRLRSPRAAPEEFLRIFQ